MLTSQPITEFVATARSYCLFIETAQSNDPRQFLRTIQKDLLSLYRMGIDLPEIEPASTTEEVKDEKINMERVLRFIQHRLPFAYYWEVINPLDAANPTQIGTGDLMDDLGDIYKDLKRGLHLYERIDTTTRENAVWHFKFDFENHWSMHCLNALLVIHHYLNRHE